MDDLISRQAAIDEIKALYEWHDIVTEDRAIDHFKRLPSAQPEITEDDVKEFCRKRCLIVVTSDLYDEMIRRWASAERRGRWIPVTERLPAYGEEVLLSTNGDCRIGYLVPTYDKRQYEWHHLGFFYFFNEVDAWMPLPEPYKEGEQNG